jgi:hypothetical protein
MVVTPLSVDFLSSRVLAERLDKRLAPWLTISRYSIGLNPEAKFWLDASELESSLKIAQHRWAHYGSLSDVAAEQLAQTLMLYRGDFLEGFHVRGALGFEN